MIPMEVFDNGETALAFQKEQAAQGNRCYMTTAHRTIDVSGKEIMMPLKNLRQRIRALIMRSDVDSIAIIGRP